MSVTWVKPCTAFPSLAKSISQHLFKWWKCVDVPVTGRRDFFRAQSDVVRVLQKVLVCTDESSARDV